jgi:hypothetical protein
VPHFWARKPGAPSRSPGSLFRSGLLSATPDLPPLALIFTNVVEEEFSELPELNILGSSYPGSWIPVPIGPGLSRSWLERDAYEASSKILRG